MAAVTGKEAPKTMRVLGTIQGCDILILVDSGSSHTFISDRVVRHLSGVSAMEKSVQVKVADGNILQCYSELKNATWSIQSCTFQSDLKVLSLSCFDMILGMDWLETYSPMKVHWREKWMTIPYLGSNVLIQGPVPTIPEGAVIEVCHVEVLLETQCVEMQLPPEI
uniref:Peptidase A2 domain-containing protein n=1 Tax=Arundo donax TaxID=35708 RepID=A0A0A9HL31_ARUDO